MNPDYSVRFVRPGPTFAQRIASEYEYDRQLAFEAIKPLKRGLKGKRRRKKK